MIKPEPNIRTKDVLVMAFLKTKYWGLFRDIESNRDLYTQIRISDQRASLLYDEKQEQEYRKKHFNNLFEKLGYNVNETELLHHILNETFPGWNGSSNVSGDDLLADRRVAHRDLLDLYFAHGISHKEFQDRMKRVRPIISKVTKGKYNEKNLIRTFRDFNRYALKQEQSADVARLLARNLLRIQREKPISVIVWRCWMRALLKYGAGSYETANAVLASILSGANDSINRTILPHKTSRDDAAAIIDYRVDLAHELFEEVDTYIDDPYFVLLLLLFVLPERGNSFFPDYVQRHSMDELYIPLLKYVDNYFIDGGRNVFYEYRWPEWAFILYQWSYNISSGEQINSNVPNAEVRHRKVNNYVFALLRNEPDLVYEFIKRQFWGEDLYNAYGRTEGWQIAGKMSQYNTDEDRQNIKDVVKLALTKAKITKDQREGLKAFEAAFNEFNTPKRA